jgi:hypothetical protein
VHFASHVAQHAELSNFAAQVPSKRTEINLLYGPSNAIELDYPGQVVARARFAGEIVPTPGNETRAMMKRIENWRVFFFGQQILQQSLEPAIHLKEVLAFDPLKVFQSWHR